MKKKNIILIGVIVIIVIVFAFGVGFVLSVVKDSANTNEKVENIEKTYSLFEEYVSEYVKTQDGSYSVILKIKEPMIPQSLLEIKLKTPTRHTAIATCKKWRDNAPNVFEYLYDNVIDN